MKKKWFVGLSVSMFSLVATASAYSFGYANFSSAASDIIQWIEDIFGPFFAALLGTNQFDANFFAKILFLILVFVVVYSVLNTKVKIFKDSRFSSGIVALAVSLLGARYVSDFAFFSYVLLPYQIFVIGIVNGLILLIVFYFIQSNEDRNARRVMWIVFLAVLFAVWMSRTGELGDANLVYAIIFFVGVIALLLDGYIHNRIIFSEWRNRSRDRRIVNLTTRYRTIEDNPHPAAVRERESIVEELRRMGISLN